MAKESLYILLGERPEDSHFESSNHFKKILKEGSLKQVVSRWLSNGNNGTIYKKIDDFEVIEGRR